MKPRLDNHLYYFTVEDESLLAETFPRFEDEVHAIAFKVVGTDDVFVTTAETRAAMDRHDVPYNQLADEDGIRISVLHTAVSREELADYEAALRALALAHRAIGLICVGVHGEIKLDFDAGGDRYTYFTAPAGHTFLVRLVADRDEAEEYIDAHLEDDAEAIEWLETLPIASAEELAGYH